MMSRESRYKFINGIYDILEELGDDIKPTEIYGVLETVKMDVHDGAVKTIKEAQRDRKGI